MARLARRLALPGSGTVSRSNANRWLWLPLAAGRRLGYVAIACLALMLSAAAGRPRIDLEGTWDFYPDVGDAALAGLTAPPQKISVPGAWQTQGYGPPGGVIPSSVIGSDLSPADYLRHNLAARCLYAREVEVPAAWHGNRVFLCVRRVYRYADVTVNGRRLGEHEGFCSPFEFDVTDAIRGGERNQLVVGVDNRPRPGRDTVGTANYFGNWGGFGGAVYLEARPPVRLADVFAIPRVAESRVLLRIELAADGRTSLDGLRIEAEVALTNAAGTAGVPPPSPTGGVDVPPALFPASNSSPDADTALSAPATLDLPVDLPDARLWTPETPSLYVARVRLLRGTQSLDELSVRFGMREITAQGRRLFLNGKPLYLSGYGDDATEPLTGMLPNDKAVYRHRLQLMRSLGFNFVRHHSCIPHDEYFDAADEVGMLVQPEAGMAYVKYWPKAHVLFAREWPQIVRAFRNHPCIWAWCMGNELFLNDLPEDDTNAHAIALDPARPLASGPLRTVAVEDNGVFGPPGQFPTQSFKQLNYYRDVEVEVDDEHHRLLGRASTSQVFRDGPHELGLKFTSSRDGRVTRIRYLRLAEEQGSHVGRLWDAGGRELARVGFTNETASGWQEAILAEPAPLRANAVYVVSVNANTAYAATSSGGADFSRQDAIAIVAEAYRQAKVLDPTRLVHASDGGTPQEFSDVYSAGGAERYGPKPFLLHEYGTYTCSLPDFSLIPRLNGIIRPLTYERAERYVRERHLETVYPRLRRSSLLMRAEAQKHYLEAAKAGSGNNGFSFWLGIDFPDSPEGCWDEGILNQLWEPKPYLTNGLPDMAGPTVLLCEVGLEARSYYNDTAKAVGLRLWHYGQHPIRDARLSWRVIEAGHVIQQGSRDGLTCEPGEAVPAGEVLLASPPGSMPRFARLEVELQQGMQRITGNQWGFCGYPRGTREAPRPGVYSEAGALPGALNLSTNSPFPSDLRLLITPELRRARHAALLRGGNCAVLLLGTGGFKETRTGYFLNQFGSAFGGIIEDHPVFASLPHDGWLHPNLYQLIAGGRLLDAESMPAPLRDGAVVWGLKLTAWISPGKDLNRALQWTEVVTGDRLHLVLCSLDLLSDRPESRYVLERTLDYLLTEPPSPIARPAVLADLDPLLK